MRFLASVQPVQARRTLTAVGLSTISKALLGKPLDKRCQMSDWEQRPLSERQVEYAAMDAWVLPQLLERLMEELGREEGERLVEQYKSSYQVGKGRGLGAGAEGRGVGVRCNGCLGAATAAGEVDGGAWEGGGGEAGGTVQV